MVAAREVLIVGLNYAPEPTGIARYTTGLARMLAEAGHHVRVITGFPFYPQWAVLDGYRGRRMEELDGPKDNPVRVTRVYHPVPGNPTGPSRILMEAVFAIHAATVRTPETPDVVLAISPALLSVATARWRWQRPGRTAVGVVTQDLYSAALTCTGALGGRGARAARELERRVLSGADGVSAIHASFRASLIRLGVEPERISIVRNWSHVTDAPADATAQRRGLGWPEDHTIALHAGNMGAKQGLENVLEAARIAGASDLPVTFVLLGDGNRRAVLVDAARGIDRLRFVEPVPDEDFPTALAAADVLVLNERPGASEMCVPSKLTSYFAAARPVVAATDDVGAAAFEVRAANAGVVLPPGRPKLLLDAVSALAADPVGAQRLGENGRRYARTTYAERTARAGYLAWVDALGRPRPTADATRNDIPLPRAATPTAAFRKSPA